MCEPMKAIIFSMENAVSQNLAEGEVGGQLVKSTHFRDGSRSSQGRGRRPPTGNASLKYSWKILYLHEVNGNLARVPPPLNPPHRFAKQAQVVIRQVNGPKTPFKLPPTHPRLRALHERSCAAIFMAQSHQESQWYLARHSYFSLVQLCLKSFVGSVCCFEFGSLFATCTKMCNDLRR